VMAGGWQPVSAILERSGKGEEGSRRVFYCWKGERPRHPNAPQLDGTGEIRIESADRAAGYFTTRTLPAPVRLSVCRKKTRAPKADGNAGGGRAHPAPTV